MAVLGVYCLPKSNSPPTDKKFGGSSVIGMSVRTGWAETEPEEGVYDFAYIDSVISAARVLNKKIMLRILAGKTSPLWIYDAGVQRIDYFNTNPNSPSFGEPRTSPNILDQLYIDKWTNLVSVMGTRYSREDRIDLIHMTGPCEGGELHFPLKTDTALWASLGYTKDLIVDRWKQTIDAYNSVLPFHPLALAVVNPHLDDGAKEEIADYAFLELGQRFHCQGNYLAVTTNPSFEPYQLVSSFSPHTTTGFQMLWSASNDPLNRMSGDLKGAIDVGLVAGVKYFEIYYKDIIDPDLLDEIEYAATSVGAPVGLPSTLGDSPPATLASVEYNNSILYGNNREYIEHTDRFGDRSVSVVVQAYSQSSRVPT